MRRYSMFPSFNSLWNSFDDVLKETVRDFSVDILEKDDGVSIIANMAGIPKEDIEISVKDSILSIKAERKKEEGEYSKQEISSGEISRSFSIGDDFDLENISAETKEGLLIISLSKRKEVIDKSKKIEVEIK
jgi:HSP20 family protein